MSSILFFMFKEKHHAARLFAGFFICVVLSLSISDSVYPQEKTEPEGFVFRFAPPDGIKFTVNAKVNEVKSLGEFEQHTTVSELETNVVINKSDDGCKIIHKLKSADVKRDGKDFPNPVSSLLKDIQITYEVDKYGQIVSVSGYDKLIEKLKEMTTESAAEALSEVKDEQVLVGKDMAEWNSKIGYFIGLTPAVGDMWIMVEQYPMPTGEMIYYYSALKFVEKVKCGGSECIKITFDYNTSAETLAEQVEMTKEKIVESAGLAGDLVNVADVAIEGEGERLIDPATMLIYSETITRTVKMDMEIPGKGTVRGIKREKREYSYDYGK
ncbi:MAG: hypothetical protein AB1546_15500 [bacterium]